ncbi:MAG TPA: ribonuclease III [bacterium]|nr:ribonuclease III [bacterium]
MKSGAIGRFLEKKGLSGSKEIEEALTHKSAELPHYERLEFLGDAVIGLVVSEFLYENFYHEDVGEMARLKGYLVSRDVLYRIGVKNRIAEAAKTGNTLKRAEIRKNKNIVSDMVESVIGAVYLLLGLEETRALINTVYSSEYKLIKKKRDLGDYKSELQMKSLGAGYGLPEYTITKSAGKEHSKRFYVAAGINGIIRGRGSGASLKEAEQSAAKQALKKHF